MKIAAVSVADILDAWQHLTPEEFGWATRLMFKYYSRELLYDTEDCAKFVGVSRCVWLRRVRPALLKKACFFIDGDQIKHPRVERDIEYCKARKTAKTTEKVAEKDQNIPLKIPQLFGENAPATINKINDLQNPSPSPSPSIVEKERVYVSRETPSDMPGFSPLAHGAMINCESIRHPDFVISIAAVKMQLALTFPDVDARQACSIAAVQWAAAIEGGQHAHKVVPGNIVGSIVGGVRMGKFRDAEHEVRKSRTPNARPGKKTLREILDERAAAGVAQ